MPKAKPTQVIVHRIELQEKEREYLDRVTTGYAIKNTVLPIAITGGVVAGSYIAYKYLKGVVDWGKDLVDDTIEMGKEFGTEVVFGKDEITSAETGDVIKNPAHGIPIVGSLFSLGMDLGNRYKPSWDINLKPDFNIFD